MNHPRAGVIVRWLAWLAVLAALTAAMLIFRGRLDKAHIALLYLLLVLLGTLSGGRALGLSLAGFAFLLFNWFFIQPYNTLRIYDPLDWLVLVSFLVVTAIAAEMLHRLRREADIARQRAAEVNQFAALGAETLKEGSPDAALEAVRGVIQSTLQLTACRIHPADAEPGGDGLDPYVALARNAGQSVAQLPDGATHMGDVATPGNEPPVALFIPLRAEQRIVGVLEIRREAGLVFDPSQRRFLEALGYYAAIAIERRRLTAEANRVVALREADRIKDALLASVSHDLRTPLTTIKAVAHDLRTVDARALVIEEEADRLNRMVADLLDLSRLQGGALPVKLELNAVDDLIGALVQRVAGLLGERVLDVRFADSSTLLVGRFDFVHALRILVNLVENAHKYSPAGAPIRVDIRRHGEWLQFAVTDRGRGIAPDERERIFEPFYRPAAAISDSGSAGLGLSIARRLAELQHGTLTYAPRSGGGSEFILSLPAADLPDGTIAS